MNPARRIPDGEFEAVWLPVRQKIARDAVPIPIQVLDSCMKKGLFVDPTWRVIPLISGIEFGITSPTYNKDTWQDTTTPGIYEFDPLFKTVLERGISEICLSDDKSSDNVPTWKDGYHFAVYPNKEGLDDLRTDRILGRKPWITGLVFDLSAEWGLVNLSFDDLSFLGGTAEFMEHYLTNAGGYDYVKQRFYDFDLWGWGSLLREKEQIFADWIYGYMGWEKPVYPPDSCGYIEPEPEENS
ncbi:MAG: hypothetical protein HQL45_12345 [Alphaproteobacteria bacterium]|nr:hypothetical protein [Alphaproteobacteria bacterium]